MDEREATYDEVEETVAIPFATRPGHSGRMNYFKSLNGFNIRVTLAIGRRGEQVVVTVWKEPLP
jgi:hypothetical protein